MAESLPGLENLDPLFQHKLRLGACVLLSTAKEISFANLKRNLESTDGNLGAQMRKLEEGGYVLSRKQFVERKPITTYSLTDEGYVAMERHLEALKELMSVTHKSARK